eukprot:jgi/Mesvir1/15080/Mv14724-RA.1
MEIEDLLTGLPAYDAGHVKTPMTALRILAEPPYPPAVEYEIYDHFVFDDPSLVLDTKTNKLMFEVDRLPYSDIIHSIESDADLRVRLGNEELEPKSVMVVNTLGQYARKGVVVYVDPVKNTPFSFFIRYKCYLLLNYDLVKRIKTSQEVFTKTHVYRHGMILPRSE